MTALKSKADAGAAAGLAWLAILIDAEEHLTVLHRMRVLREHFLHHAGELGLDLVHDLHRLDDAQRLSLRDTLARSYECLPARLGRVVVRTDHRRLHLER